MTEASDLTAEQGAEALRIVAIEYERALELAPAVLPPGQAAAAVYFLRAQESNIAIVADPYVDGRKMNLLDGTLQRAAEASALVAEILRMDET